MGGNVHECARSPRPAECRKSADGGTADSGFVVFQRLNQDSLESGFAPGTKECLSPRLRISGSKRRLDFCRRKLPFACLFVSHLSHTRVWEVGSSRYWSKVPSLPTRENLPNRAPANHQNRAPEGLPSRIPGSRLSPNRRNRRGR